MKDLFLPYDLLLELKGLGFDKPCLAYYNKKELFSFTQNCNEPVKGHYIKVSNRLCAPTYLQAIDWFQEKYGIYIGRTGYNDGKTPKRWVFHVDDHYVQDQSWNGAIKYAIELIKKGNYE